MSHTSGIKHGWEYVKMKSQFRKKEIGYSFCQVTNKSLAIFADDRLAMQFYLLINIKELFGQCLYTNCPLCLER